MIKGVQKLVVEVEDQDRALRFWTNAVGFEVGRKDAKPRAKLPEPAAIRRLAAEHSVGRAIQRDRWERGFVEGYHDGFRNIVTGQK